MENKKLIKQITPIPVRWNLTLIFSRSFKINCHFIFNEGAGSGKAVPHYIYFFEAIELITMELKYLNFRLFEADLKLRIRPSSSAGNSGNGSSSSSERIRFSDPEFAEAENQYFSSLFSGALSKSMCKHSVWRTPSSFSVIVKYLILFLFATWKYNLRRAYI